MTFWRCPVVGGDGESLEFDAERRVWACPHGHVFDVAREGYVNLLVTHQRRHRPPGDSAEMVRRRRAFLDAGHYAPLREAIVDALDSALGPVVAGGPPRNIVDAGCGEGYYCRTWPDHFGAAVAGVDIAKAAVRAAARRSAEPGRVEFAVASVYDLPLPDSWAAALVSVFAPIDTASFDRVLRPGGALVTVTPGPRHLWQLKEHLFDAPEEHPVDPPLPGPVDVRRLAYTIDLQGEGTAGDLLGMTPYVWYLDQATRDRVEALPRLRTEVDFAVSIYRRG